MVPEFDSPAHVGAGWQNTGFTTCYDKLPWNLYCVGPPCGQIDPTVDGLYDFLEGTEHLKHKKVRLGGSYNENSIGGAVPSNQFCYHEKYYRLHSCQNFKNSNSLLVLLHNSAYTNQ